MQVVDQRAPIFVFLGNTQMNRQVRLEVRQLDPLIGRGVTEARAPKVAPVVGGLLVEKLLTEDSCVCAAPARRVQCGDGVRVVPRRGAEEGVRGHA